MWKTEFIEETVCTANGKYYDKAQFAARSPKSVGIWQKSPVESRRYLSSIMPARSWWAQLGRGWLNETKPLANIHFHRKAM